MTNFAQKTALVTGAGGGIGQAIVRALRELGVTVAGADIHDCDADHVFRGDLTDPSFCDSLPKRAADRMGKLGSRLIKLDPQSDGCQFDHRQEIA